MTNDLRDHEDADVETLPRVDDVFAPSSGHGTVQAPQGAGKPTPGKAAGSGDSVRGMRSLVKAPGGKDASRSKDGG